MNEIELAEVNHMRCSLSLVYPPVSNQEAEWVKKDPEVERAIEASSFYMMAAREQMKFHDFTLGGRPIDENGLDVTAGLPTDATLRFRVTVGDRLTDDVELDIEGLTRDAFEGQRIPSTYWVEAGEKLVRIEYIVDPQVPSQNRIVWFTTEKLLHDRSRRYSWIKGFNSFRDFATYELLYVGIATKMGTFKRLFQKAHHARQSILSNEPVRTPGERMRVTDEIYLFPFRLEPIVLKSMGEDYDLAESDFYGTDEYYDTVVKDAEKAFIRAMDPGYNDVKYESYPASKDGLYGQHDSYLFLLDESLTFTTESLTFRGTDLPGFGIGGGDAIAISGDSVEIRSAAED